MSHLKSIEDMKRKILEKKKAAELQKETQTEQKPQQQQSEVYQHTRSHKAEQTLELPIEKSQKKRKTRRQSRQQDELVLISRNESEISQLSQHYVQKVIPQTLEQPNSYKLLQIVEPAVQTQKQTDMQIIEQQSHQADMDTVEYQHPIVIRPRQVQRGSCKITYKEEQRLRIATLNLARALEAFTAIEPSRVTLQNAILHLRNVLSS